MPKDTTQCFIPAYLHFDIAANRLFLSGSWTSLCLNDQALNATLQTIPIGGKIVIDGRELEALDTTGAMAILHLRARLEQAGISRIDLEGFAKPYQHLLSLVKETPADKPLQPRQLGLLEHLGKISLDILTDMVAYLAFIGSLTTQSLRWLFNPRRIRLREILAEIQVAGVNALFIVGLLSFLMGVVIAYQGGGPLDQYGANVFIVDLVGLTILREIAPLVTAIIMAGRTGSAYTAEIGAMRITEEVDALRSLALHPLEILALPKLAALIIVMPLLIVFADLAGLAGGIVVSDLMLGVGIESYIERLPQTFLMPSSFWVGLVKAPVYALIITSIGCHQGFQVRGGATSVGYATTRSVVQSIFLVIVVDALFSIIFNKLDL